MVKSDSFEPDYNAEDTLRNRLVTQYAQEPSAVAPPDQLPAPPQPSPQQSASTDVPATNESYQAPFDPQAQTPNAPSQLGFNTPEPPRAGPAPSPFSGPLLPTPGPPPAPSAGPGGDPLAFIRQWQGSHSPGEGIGPLANALASGGYGVPRYMYGSIPSNNELVLNGQKFKVLGADGTPGQYWYTGGDDSPPVGAAGPKAAATTAAMQPRLSAAAPQGGSFGSPSGSAPQGIWGADFLAQIRQMLMQRLQSASGPVDENASGITQAVTGARDQATRANDASRTALAERLYAHGGLNTDAIGQSVQQSNERSGTALGTLRAQLVMKEYDRKQTELKDLMGMAIQAGDAEMARGIQMQLAELQAQIQREGLGVQREGIGAQLAMYQQNQNNQAGSLF